MSFLRKGRFSDESTSSRSKQYFLEGDDVDDDPLYLPSSKKVYVTQTRDGRPALGRKKKDKLLQGYGFDILGQSLGIPSRIDFERQSRRMSIGSQSSGITNSDIPRTRKSILKPSYRPDNNSSEYVLEDPYTVRKTRGARSSSSPNPSAPHQPVAGTNTMPYHDHVSGHASSYFMSGGLNPPPPPPLPAYPSHFWNTQHVMNGMPPMAPGYTPMTNYQPAHIHGYPPQVTHAHGPFSLAMPQPPVTRQYANPGYFPGIQSSPMPIFPQQQYPAQYQPVDPYPHATYFPPPPPPPPMPPRSKVPPQGFVVGVVDDSPVKSTEKQPKDDGGRSTSTGDKNCPRRPGKHTRDTSQRGLEERARISKRIRHVHVCAGCGKKRSRKYQRAHPLKRGEIPEPDYCHRCIRDAAVTDTDSSSDITADDGSFIQFAKEAPVSGLSTDENHTVGRGKYAQEKTRRGPRWIRKSRPLSNLSGMLSSGKSSRVRLDPAMSVSSAEESRSRASSPTPGADLNIRNGKRPGASANSSRSRSKERKPLSEVTPSTRDLQVPVDKASDLSKAASRGNSPSSAARLTRVKRPERMISPGPLASSNSRVPHTTGIATSSKKNEWKESSKAPRQREPQASSTGPPVMPSRVSSNNPFVNSSQVSSQPPSMVSSGTATVPKPPAKGVTSANAPKISSTRYMRPSFRNESSELGVQTSSNIGHGTRDNPDGRREPCPRIPETQSQSSRGQSPKEEFVPFPDGNARSRFEDWQDSYFPEPNSVPKFTYTSKWEEPRTPSDAPHGGPTALPCFVRDSWSYNQSDIEREAEEMAERDLAEAESCDSDEDRNDGNVAFEMAEASDVEDTVRDEDKLIKKLEFSSEDDRHQKITEQALKELSSKRSAEIRKNLPNPLNQYSRNLYDNDDDNSDNSFEILPPAPGSSLIAHSGHSFDDVAMDRGDEQQEVGPNVYGALHRLRRFVRL